MDIRTEEQRRHDLAMPDSNPFSHNEESHVEWDVAKSDPEDRQVTIASVSNMSRILTPA
jgi:hypothetical protein